MNPARPKQTTSQELLDDLLRFVGQKFYTDDYKAFAQDRQHLLKWVILWPAGWFNKRGVTVTGERYKKIFTDVMLNAVRHGNTNQINYRPAWLKMVIQSHFAVHGEEYYAEAKNVRNLAEHAMLVVGKAVGASQPDPVKELATAHALLARSKPKRKTIVKVALNMELKLT